VRVRLGNSHNKAGTEDKPQYHLRDYRTNHFYWESTQPLVYEFVDGDDAYIRLAVEESSEDDDTSMVSGSNPSYTFNGIECLGIIPGHLRVLKPPHNSLSNKTNTSAKKGLAFAPLR
jgi:hypothetical protein